MTEEIFEEVTEQHLAQFLLHYGKPLYWEVMEMYQPSAVGWFDDSLGEWPANLIAIKDLDDVPVFYIRTVTLH